MIIFKKFNTLIIVISLVFNSSGVFAGFVWESSWLDFFKKIDTWYTTYQTRLIENALVWSAEAINVYLSKNWSPKLDILIDFTKTELDTIVDWWLTPIFKRMDFTWSNNSPNTNTIDSMAKLIAKRYIETQVETKKLITNVSKVSVIWLYNDWDLGNSWYDIVDDIERIHSVIFADNPKYSWITNSAASDFNNILTWLNETSLSLNLSWVLNPSWNDNWNTPINNTNDNSDKNSNSSNLCDTWISLTWLDGSLLNDLNRQVNLWENSNSINWWLWNWVRSPYNNWNLNAWNNGSWLWNNGTGKWPCTWFICITIEMTSYSQWLLWWWGSSIESIIDKNFKVITKTASQFWWASDITKWNFILSILRGLDLPSMLHLWNIVSSLPPPILNLDDSKNSTSWWDKSKKVWTCWDLKNTEILSSAYRQWGLDYIRPNYLNPDFENRDFSNSPWLTTNTTMDRVLATANSETPKVNEMNVLIATLKNNCNWWLNDNVSELVWFSNTFKLDIRTILNYVNEMSKR